MRVVRWLGFVVLLVPAGFGVFISLVFACISFMGFDAPGSDKQVLPYLLVVGAWLNLPLATALLISGVKAMSGGRAHRACLCLTFPAALAVAFVVWVKSG